MEQTTINQPVNEAAGVTERKVIVMCVRDTGDIVLIDSSENKTFFRGATVNANYFVVAFTIPVADLEGKSGRPSKVQKPKGQGVYGFFKNYNLTSV